MEVASKVIDCAFVEARSVKNGVGLVKLMGRDSGFVARRQAGPSHHGEKEGFEVGAVKTHNLNVARIEKFRKSLTC